MGAAGSKLEKALGNQFPEGERYFGLENFGNTCYCNSVLQRSGCLGSTLAVMKKSSKLLPKVQSQDEEVKNFGKCNKAIEKESSHSGESDEE